MNEFQSVNGQTNLAELLAPSLAYELQIVPLFFLGETLVVATTSPLSSETEDRLRFVLSRNVRGVVRSAESIASDLQELYGRPLQPDRKFDDVTWYQPEGHWFDGDQLNISCSGWSGSSHWSGCQEFPADHPDFHMWCWIVSVPQYHRLIDIGEIPGIRRIWNRYLRRRKQGSRS
jgi:MshEN domain